MVVEYLVIESEDMPIKLQCLIGPKGDYKDPSLIFDLGGRNNDTEEWVNPSYILELFKSLESDTHTHQYMEFMFFCSQFNFDLDKTKVALLNIYEEAKIRGVKF